MNISLQEQRRQVREAKSLVKGYLKRQDITGIQFGFKTVRGKPLPLLSIRFRVDQKKPHNKLSRKERIPARIGRFPTDVIDHNVQLQSLRRVRPHEKVSPLIGGIEIQSSFFDQRSGWGTLGCIQEVSGVPHGFTSYHVALGNLTEDQARNYIDYLRIYQPNQPNGGRVIGRLTPLFDRKLDYCAFILEAPVDEQQSLNSIPGLVRQSVYPVTGMRVGKAGAATGYTMGMIEALSLVDSFQLVIRYEPGPENESGLISSFGDSGSLWVLKEGNTLKRVGLHYGGDTRQNVAYATSFVSIAGSVTSKTQNQLYEQNASSFNGSNLYRRIVRPA